MNIDYESIYKTVKIGDEEILQYNDSYEVPKRLSGKKINIVGFTKTKVKVTNGYETINIKYEQIRRIAQEIQRKGREFLENVKE